MEVNMISILKCDLREKKRKGQSYTEKILRLWAKNLCALLMKNKKCKLSFCRRILIIFLLQI